MKPYTLTIHEAGKLLRKREISSRELTQSVLSRITEVEKKVNAFITVSEGYALKQADAADKAISKGEIHPLTGIPLSIKDLICTNFMPTTCGSKILESYVPPFNATVMEKLLNQHAVIVGKANMDEFAMGSSTETSFFKPTKNPWDTSRIPGGSSGGSAVSVASDMCIASLGSDTGGSIRQPASHCGVVGLKPTYGRVSRFGLVAFASSLDQIGPITKDVADCAMLLDAISGHDRRDSTSVPVDVPNFTSFLTDGLENVTIGIPKEYFDVEGIDPDVEESVKSAIDTIRNLGASVIEISLPHTPYVVAVYYVIAPCEASSNLARYDGVKYGFRDSEKKALIEMYRSTRSGGFGAEVKRRIIIGTYCLSAGYYDAYYGKASQVRTLIRNDFTEAFTKCDAILAPVAPTPAFKIGENIDDPLTMYLGDIFTLSANLAGIPGMSVPCGFSGNGLPIGLQILGNHFNEGMILKVAHNFEKATSFHDRKPAL